MTSGAGAALFIGGFVLCFVIVGGGLCLVYDIGSFNGRRRENCYVCGLDLCNYCWCGSRLRGERDVEVAPPVNLRR